MRARKVLRRFFDVLPGEGRLAGLMAAHALFMGLSTVFFETAASALFLAHYGGATLPYVYLAAAVLNTAVGLGFTTIEARVRFGRLMQGTLLMLLVSALGFRLGLAWSGAAWLTFGLLVWYRVLSILTDLEYWALAARLYDVRQAKRLYGLIGSGEVIARIGGSFAVPLLLLVIGVADLLLLSAVALGACLALLTVVLSKATTATEPTAKRESPARERLSALVHDRYVVLIVAVAGFAVLGKYFVDFAFLEQMRSRYSGLRQLATFFSLFSGLTQALSLLTRLFLSGRVLNRFGVRVGLLILPAAHVLCTLPIAIAGFGLGAAPLVFWLSVANQGLYKTLKHPIDNPSFKVLYQPLRRTQRLTMQIWVETVVTPLVIGLAALVMLAFNTLIPYDPTRFAYALLVTFVLWASLATRVGRAYASALVRALRGRIEDIRFSFEDPDSVIALKGIVEHGRAADIPFALTLLERVEGDRAGPLLTRFLAHPDPDVRLTALNRLEELRPAAALGAVRSHARGETEPRLRAAALRALAAIGGSSVFAEVAGQLDHPDATVRRGALSALLRRGAPEASLRLAALCGGADEAARITAGRALAEAAARGHHECLRRLLRDPSAAVRRTALGALAKTRDPELWPTALALLGEQPLGPAAAQALAAGGPAVVPLLAGILAGGQGPDLVTRAAQVLARIRGHEARAALVGVVDYPDAVVRNAICAALWTSGASLEPDGRERVEAQVRNECRETRRHLEAYAELALNARLQLLAAALLIEIEHARERILHLLGLLVERAVVERVQAQRGAVSNEKRAYALEALDVVLPQHLRLEVLPVLGEAQPLDTTTAPSRGRLETRISDLLSRGQAWVSPWTHACAVDGAARLGFAKLAPAIDALQRATAARPYLVAVCAQALAQLGQAPEPDGKRETPGGFMQTIEKVVTLKAVHMFAETPEDVLADIAAILEEVRHEAGAVIIEKGAPGDSMYVIVEGRVRVYDGERTIATLGERDIFGELALLDPEPRFASVAAEADTRLFRLDREAFLELMSGNIEIVRGVLHVLCERLRRTVREGRHR